MATQFQALEKSKDARASSHANSSYVLITPAKNEERTIETTIQSVLSQTLLPREWIIVSDGSTDKTDEIVQRYAAEHPFISLMQRKASSLRSFASVVFATEDGYKHLKTKDYGYIGLLDADVRFESTYFATLISRFKSDGLLGMAGGQVLDLINGKLKPEPQFSEDVAGAVQFFRRESFESMGGLVAIPEGGWDTITCLQVRANGYRTRIFKELIVEHLKPRNSAEGGLFKRHWQFGFRDYAMGYHPVFELVKCGARILEYPAVIGAAARLTGFSACYLVRRKRMISRELINKIRAERFERLKFWRFGRHPLPTGVGQNSSGS